MYFNREIHRLQPLIFKGCVSFRGVSKSDKLQVCNRFQRQNHFVWLFWGSVKAQMSPATSSISPFYNRGDHINVYI